MTVRSALADALSAPQPDALWTLRAELLEAGLDGEAQAWRVLDAFHGYLDELATSTTSRQYSDLASKLDIGAVGGIVLEQVLENERADELAMRLLSAALSEGLMVAATRQHVKAWEGELAAVYRRAAWTLYGELWHWAARRKPELPAAERRQLLGRLLDPARADATPGLARALLVGLLFQVLLLSCLTEDLPQLRG